MPLYKAYGELTSGGAPRSPFLLDLNGITPVALVETATAPDLTVQLEILALTEPGGGGSGLGVRAYLAPVSGRVLTDLALRVVILPTGDLTDLTEGTTPDPGTVDFVSLQYRTTGPEPMPANVVLELGQLSKVSTTLDATAPPDKRVDDEYKVEACVPGVLAPLHLVGGLTSGPMIIFPGRRINPTGAYGEHDTHIRGIDLARVLGVPAPATATSPTSATWFDVTVHPPDTLPVGGQTHLKVTVRMPHAGTGPATAPAAAHASGTGGLPAGDYVYKVAFADTNSNETSLSPGSTKVTVPADAAVDVTNIPTGGPPPAANPEYAVVERRLYRNGPNGGEDTLVGVLPGPAHPDAPNPLPTTFTDTNAPIDVGGGHTLAAGYFHNAARLCVRYTADTALDLDGAVVLASAGTGEAGIDRYHGTVTAAPVTALVIKDDQAPLRASLQPSALDRTRLRWSADSRAPQATVQLPGMSTPFGTGADVRIDDVPEVFGFDWRTDGDLLTALDVRATDDLTPIADPAPPVGPALDVFGRVAVRLGPGFPAAAWPVGEATVGAEIRDTTSSDRYGAFAVRGARWGAFNQGVGTAGPFDRDAIGGELLLGDDPDRPPGHDRSVRFLRERIRYLSHRFRFYDYDDSLRWWARAGNLTDRVSVSFKPFTSSLDAGSESSQPFTLNGRLDRVVAQVLDGRAYLAPDDPTGLRVWASLATTGQPTDDSAPTLGLRVDTVTLGGKTLSTDVLLDAVDGLHAEATVNGAPISSRPATIDAQLRIPPKLHLQFSDDTLVEAAPDGTWGRVGLAWAGNPVGTRANPQARVRNRPTAAPADQVEAATVRLLGASRVQLHQSDSDSVSVTRAGGSLTDDRPNRSFRFEYLEIDPRVQPAVRTVWKARVGDLPDELSGEMHTSTDPGGAFFFAKAATNTPITGGVLWAEPAQTRSDPLDPRGVLAGIGNVSALLDTLPVSLELVLLDKVPVSRQDDPDYGGGERLPRVNPVASPTHTSGARVRLGGPLMASSIRIASFDGDAGVCLDKDTKQNGMRSSWKETIIPVLNVAIDSSADISDDPVAGTSIWYWTPDDVPPSTSAPVLPCDPQPDPPDATKDTAFRIGGGLLVDLAYRDYALQDRSDRPFSRWDGFTATTDVNGDAVGTWMFKQEIQMQGYRGEITIADLPSTLDSLDNPFGDWEAGPGLWYLRARDKLKLAIYTGDLYMGNTGSTGTSFHIPFSNGLFSTLPAIFNITWP